MIVGETEVVKGRAHGPRTGHHGPGGNVAVVKVKTGQGPGVQEAREAGRGDTAIVATSSYVSQLGAQPDRPG